MKKKKSISERKYPQGYYICISVGFGIMFGLLFGMAIHNIPFGPVIGVLLGLLIGVILENKYNPKKN